VSTKVEDAARVAEAVRENLYVHVRLCDQGLAPTADERQVLAGSLPELRAFGSHRFAHVRAILDWDHRIPSEGMLLRIYAAYSDKEGRRLDAAIDGRKTEIAGDNLYPEFDVPDFGGLDASETYVAALGRGQYRVDDLRLVSAWRRKVDDAPCEAALSAVRRRRSYLLARGRPEADILGDAMVVGWAPPCTAHSPNWALEVWLLVEFDGRVGKTLVFQVDSATFEVTREYVVDVTIT
jgi:hypothetical protein